MSKSLTICSIIFSLFIIFLVIYLVSKKKLSVKYSLVWLFLFLCLIVFASIPYLLNLFTKWLGFQTPSNMIFAIIIAILVFINIVLTVIVSYHDKKIRLLIQEVSMLKNEKKEDK